MSEFVYAGITSQTIDIFLQDSSSTTGQGLSGLVFNSAGLVASYRKGATGSRVAISLATQTVGGAYSSGGFVEIDATNMRGVYRLDLPNVMVDAEGFVTLFLYGATNLLPTAMRIDCRALPVDIKKLLGTAWLTPAVAGTPDVNTKLAGGTAWGSGAITATSIAADAITAAKIADGAIDTATFASGTTIPRVTLVDTCTTNTDMRGTDNAALAATALSTATWTGTLATNIGTTNTTVATNLDATITSRMATYTQPTGFLAATFPSDPADQSIVIAATDAILTAVGTRLATASYTAPPSAATISTQVASDLATAHGAGSWLTATGFSTHSAADVWAVGTRTITGGSLTTAPPTAAVIADAVWDEARAGHATAGTFGEKVNAELDPATVTAIRDGIPKVGETHRYTQVASGATTTDVSIGEAI